MHFAIIAYLPLTNIQASTNIKQLHANRKPHWMSFSNLNKKSFVLEICCQVCHTANQLRHLLLDPLQRRGAFGILADSPTDFRFKMELDSKKIGKLSSSTTATFLHLFLLNGKKKTWKNCPPSTPASITALVGSFPAGVGATGCGTLGITCWSFGGASLSGFSSSTGMPIICALDSSPGRIEWQLTTVWTPLQVPWKFVELELKIIYRRNTSSIIVTELDFSIHLYCFIMIVPLHEMLECLNHGLIRNRVWNVETHK